MFTCEVTSVPDQPSTRWLQWRIQFEESLSVAGVTRSYVESDAQGHLQTDERNGLDFVFNLTLNGPLMLVSTLTVTVGSDTTSAINNATVHCGQRPYPKAELLVHSGKIIVMCLA